MNSAQRFTFALLLFLISILLFVANLHLLKFDLMYENENLESIVNASAHLISSVWLIVVIPFLLFVGTIAFFRKKGYTFLNWSLVFSVPFLLGSSVVNLYSGRYTDCYGECGRAWVDGPLFPIILFGSLGYLIFHFIDKKLSNRTLARRKNLILFTIFIVVIASSLYLVVFAVNSPLLIDSWPAEPI